MEEYKQSRHYPTPKLWTIGADSGNFEEYIDGDYRIRVYYHGCVSYYKDGKLHREEGPAVVHRNGIIYWWLKGKRCSTYEEYLDKALEFNIANIFYHLDEHLQFLEKDKFTRTKCKPSIFYGI